MKILTTILTLALLAGTLGFAADANKIVVDGSTTVGPIAKAFAEYYMKQNPGVNITVSESGSRQRRQEPGQQVLPGGHHVAAAEAERVRGGGALRDPARGPRRGPGRHRHDRPSRQPRGQADHGPGQGHLPGQDQELEPARRPQCRHRHHLARHQQRHLRNLRGQGDEGRKDRQELRIRRLQRRHPPARAEHRRPPSATWASASWTTRSRRCPSTTSCPSAETVKNGSYPIARPLYMVTNDYPKMGSHLYRFINLYLSKKGQAMIEEIGFIPVTSY